MDRSKKSRGQKVFAVLGLGRFGSSAARTLFEMGYEVLGIDSSEQRVQDMVNHVTEAVQANATDENALRALGIRNMDVCIIGVGDVATSSLTTMLVKDFGVPMVVCKASSLVHGKILSKIGADRIVYPERDMGHRLAHNLVSGNLVDYIELAPGYSVVEVRARQDYFGRSLRQIDLRAKYGVNILAVRRGDDIEINPGADFVVEEGDLLVAIGRDEKLDRLGE